ncbi:MAG TPA: cupredoxin domain-containing protein [Rhodanobacteraceae bacterium]
MKTILALASIATLSLTVAACGSSPSSPTPSSPGPDVTINILGIQGANSYNPSPTTIKAGQRVIWKNTDTRTHDTIQDANAFSVPPISAGAQSDPITLSTPGTFTYHCGIHPSMTGTITVTP